MASKSLRIRYRPIRIGWCVEDGNLNEFRRAARLTHTLSGGKFNPIIPVGSEAAKALVRHFRVDLLFPIETTEANLRFIESFPNLATPLFEQKIFDNFMGRMEPNYLDISHWLDELAHDPGRPEAGPGQPNPGSPELNRYGLVHWTQGDPLEDVLLATFGAYPPPMGIGRDYVRFIIDNLRPAIYDAKPEERIPSYLLKQMTASSISTLDLNWDRIPSSHDSAGFYAGRSNNFVDLVNYWNMRAADMNVLFLDPDHLGRLEQLRDDQIQFIFRRDMSAEFPRTINVWSREQELAGNVGIHPSALPTFFALDGISAVGPSVRPPLHYFRNRSVLGSSSDDPADPTLAVQLPEKPFDAHEELSQQHFVVSIHPPIEDVDSEHTLWTPHIPELNHWYGIQLVSQSRFLRVETEGFGVISSVTDESLEVSLIKRLDLARKLFEYAGIEAQPSTPGRIASRLIRQLGGLQGCRVLKIAGVRKLIKEYGPLKEFGRTAANSMIGNRDIAAGTGDFSAYEDLYIGPRPPGQKKLKPEDAFLYLLDKGVFRVGLALTCTICDLQFWAALDNVAELMTCEVCGSRFDIKRQLKDRDWMYRRSGLFGKDNNQEGSIPVALTLQQLSANLRSTYSGALFLTNLTLKPARAQIEPCETDLFVAIQAHETVQIVVGECKDSGGSITVDDARKMAAVADAFPREHFDPYILFSKTAPFTDDDIASCRLAQPKYSRQRVIMLTDRELEGRQIFERAAHDLQLKNTAGTLENMAEMTRQIYFSGLQV